MPNEQNNSGLFLALSCEILSSVQTVAITYPDTGITPQMLLLHISPLMPDNLPALGDQKHSPEWHCPTSSRALRI